MLFKININIHSFILQSGTSTSKEEQGDKLCGIEI